MSSIFEIAKSGLFASQKAASTVSHNIANANTPGYTRERSELSAAVLRRNGYKIGRGVTIETIQRLRNSLTDQQIMGKENDLGGLNERNRVYQQIESTLTTDAGNGLDTQLSDFFAAFSDLANNPQDISVRNVMLSKAQTLTDTFKNTAHNLEDIARQTKHSAKSRVDEINSLLQNLDKLNDDIARADAAGHPDLNGKDQQLSQLKELSKLVDSKFIYNDNGTIEVRIGGITVLNDEGASTVTAETAPGENVFRLRLDNGKLIETGNGSLAADIYMITEGIPDYQQKLDDMAQALVTEINDIHNSGYGLNDSVQRTFFDASNVSAQSISINEQLLKNPENIAASSEPGEAGNGRIASELNALKSEKILNGQTMVSNAIELISEPGTRVSELKTQIETHESALQLLKNQQQSQSGVNIDEELTDLIKYQNAYQASARVLVAGRQMYDTLLSIV
ncbi:MAG TPA: flagellar hook-associated protein FlgK [Balneolaceae bacterium]|nr:flagellar hook-associated protein FlgK [Balneolaceae bacterium]